MKFCACFICHNQFHAQKLVGKHLMDHSKSPVVMRSCGTYKQDQLEVSYCKPAGLKTNNSLSTETQRFSTDIETTTVLNDVKDEWRVY
uniref:Uncharacterized protein n=1 Tax=Octopus bimaculoides TaxID=37653 RepID=A0A0L8I8B6_OCTBM